VPQVYLPSKSMLKRVVSFNTIVLRKNYLQLYSYTEPVIQSNDNVSA
jgi:hypothetical protein